MSSLIEQLDHAYLIAYKARQEETVSTLRLIRSTCKNRCIDLGRPLTDDEVSQVLRTMAKQYDEAWQEFTHAGRTDLAERQERELVLIRSYLPAELSDEDIESIVRDVLKQTPHPVFGSVMGTAMRVVGNRADGNRVRALVQRFLSS